MCNNIVTCRVVFSLANRRPTVLHSHVWQKCTYQTLNRCCCACNDILPFTNFSLCLYCLVSTDWNTFAIYLVLQLLFRSSSLWRKAMRLFHWAACPERCLSAISGLAYGKDYLCFCLRVINSNYKCECWFVVLLQFANSGFIYSS